MKIIIIIVYSVIISHASGNQVYIAANKYSHCKKGFLACTNCGIKRGRRGWLPTGEYCAYIGHSNKCIWSSTEKTNFTSFVNACKTRGMRPLVIYSRAEDDALRAVSDSQSSLLWQEWLGVTYDPVDRTYQRVIDGKPLQSSFKGGLSVDRAPNSNRYCLRRTQKEPGNWKQTSCRDSVLHNPVCEQESEIKVRSPQSPTGGKIKTISVRIGDKISTKCVVELTPLANLTFVNLWAAKEAEFVTSSDQRVQVQEEVLWSEAKKSCRRQGYGIFTQTATRDMDGLSIACLAYKTAGSTPCSWSDRYCTVFSRIKIVGQDGGPSDKDDENSGDDSSDDSNLIVIIVVAIVVFHVLIALLFTRKQCKATPGEGETLKIFDAKTATETAETPSESNSQVQYVPVQRPARKKSPARPDKGKSKPIRSHTAPTTPAEIRSHTTLTTQSESVQHFEPPRGDKKKDKKKDKKNEKKTKKGKEKPMQEDIDSLASNKYSRASHPRF